METIKLLLLLLLLSSAREEGCTKRTWVAWLLEGQVGLMKRMLASGRRAWLCPGAGEKSTRAPMRGVVEGVEGPHILGVFTLWFIGVWLCCVVLVLIKGVSWLDVAGGFWILDSGTVGCQKIGKRTAL